MSKRKAAPQDSVSDLLADLNTILNSGAVKIGVVESFLRVSRGAIYKWLERPGYRPAKIQRNNLAQVRQLIDLWRKFGCDTEQFRERIAQELKSRQSPALLITQTLSQNGISISDYFTSSQSFGGWLIGSGTKNVRVGNKDCSVPVVVAYPNLRLDSIHLLKTMGILRKLQKDKKLNKDPKKKQQIRLVVIWDHAAADFLSWAQLVKGLELIQMPES